MFFNRLVSTLLLLFIAMTGVVVAPLVTPSSSVAQSKLNDIQNYWDQACIESLAQRNIISGYPDGSFRPNSPITRAEFSAIINQAFPSATLTRDPIQFVDVPSNYWAYTAIRKASQTKFLSGYPGNIFKPNQNIPRVQVLVALTSGLNYSPTKIVSTVLNSAFDDPSKIPNYARSAIAAATERRLVVNYPNVKLLRPEQLATRGEVAAFLCQALARPEQASLVPSQYIASISSNQATLPPAEANNIFYPLTQQSPKSWTDVSFGMSAAALKKKFAKLTLSPESDSSCLRSEGLNCQGVAQWILKNNNINSRPYDVVFQLNNDKLNTVFIKNFSGGSNDFAAFKDLLENKYGQPTNTDTKLSQIGVTRLIWRLPGNKIYLSKIQDTGVGLFYLPEKLPNQ